ncbi:hypothetical protein [Kitasatospora sp. NPDC094011]|uniref:hypothetical protein n=1 Tax=Kitasatospora sp. NPDC094011 TaxID=3364090 RepID=UPI0037F9C8DC
MRKLVSLGVAAAAALGLLAGSTGSASAIGGPQGCREHSVPVGFGIQLQPCVYNSIYANSVASTVNVYGALQSQVRVYQAVARVNADGSITDFYPSALYTVDSDLTSPGYSYQSFSHDLYCSLGGGEFVIDSWITNNDQRYGSVQSPRFTC